jgi:uncharacterized membrane protein
LAKRSPRSSPPPPAWRLRRPRLTSSLLVGIAIYAVLHFFTALNWRMCFIAAWDGAATFAFIALYLGLRGASAAAMKENAIRQDAGKWAVLAFTLIAACASLVVIASEMPVVKNATGLEKTAGVVLVVYTVMLSWAFIHTVFALHYAHDFYIDADVSASARRTHDAPRLVFPGGKPPTYGDFLYFSFTIGMTFQVSDVQIADAGFRRIVLAHGVAAFFYTTGILALAINLVAGLI